MGCDVRKPVFDGLETTNAHISLGIHMSDQRLCYSLIGSIISKFATGEITISWVLRYSLKLSRLVWHERFRNPEYRFTNDSAHIVYFAGDEE